MSTFNVSNKTVSHRFKKYIDNVVALKMLVDYRPNYICQCLKLYDLREKERDLSMKRNVLLDFV